MYNPTEIINAKVRGMYDLDHLATFTAGERQGLVSPADGMQKLKQLEKSRGIWTMSVQMVLETRDIVIIDRQTGEEMERFPLRLVTDPTAVTSNDRRDAYNNIILFTVKEEAASPSEMHIFQAVDSNARTIVDNIKDTQAGRGSQPYYEPADDGRGRNKAMAYEDVVIRNPVQNYGEPKATVRPPSDVGSSLAERTDAEVQLMNRCFDDIERFVGRLQQAADAFRELDKRKKGNKGRGKHGDGMLTMRSRPPPPKDFIDIFQKFKVCFNLLAKLKAHIHDPNAPELVHFLFTPLSLIMEASKDPVHGTPDLAAEVVSPLLTRDAKELLHNCLSSKEADLWASLGDAWTLCRDEWKGFIPPYYLRFSDGWRPHPSLLEDMEGSFRTSEPPPRKEAKPEPEYAVVKKNDAPARSPNMYHRNDPPFRDYNPTNYERNGYNYNHQPAEPRSNSFNSDFDPVNQRRIDEKKDLATMAANIANNRKSSGRDVTQQDFVRQLERKNAKICQVQHDRDGANAKELTVRRGEYLEVLDDTRNWWSMRNSQGMEGFCPYTILEPYKGGHM